MTQAKPVLDRIKAAILILENGCWQWQKSIDKAGYGRINVSDKIAYAHRVSYGAFVGPIPDGLTIDHLCRNRACVNPAHLEPVPLAENTRRGRRPALKTHCPQGHEFTEENTYQYSDNRRKCRICGREDVKRRYWAQKRANP